MSLNENKTIFEKPGYTQIWNLSSIINWRLGGIDGSVSHLVLNSAQSD